MSLALFSLRPPCLVYLQALQPSVQPDSSDMPTNAAPTLCICRITNACMPLPCSCRDIPAGHGYQEPTLITSFLPYGHLSPCHSSPGYYKRYWVVAPSIPRRPCGWMGCSRIYWSENLPLLLADICLPRATKLTYPYLRTSCIGVLLQSAVLMLSFCVFCIRLILFLFYTKCSLGDDQKYKKD